VVDVVGDVLGQTVSDWAESAASEEEDFVWLVAVWAMAGVVLKVVERPGFGCIERAGNGIVGGRSESDGFGGGR
jgi:hypothetical protein